MRVVDTFTYQELAEKVFRNRGRTSTTNGILKAEAVCRFAEAVLSSGINDFPDIYDPLKISEAEKLVKSIPGQRSGVTFHYFIMLAGDDNRLKPDTWIIRFVATALGVRESDITQTEARITISEAYQLLKEKHELLTLRALDHEIWKFQARKAVRMR